jgi:DNA-binding NtrC family response regulator
VDSKNKSRRAGTVLIVDDEQSFHDVVERHLCDFRTIAAYNGWQAKEALRAHHIDVVLLDLHLPDVNGLALLDEIRAGRDDLEVIIVTAHSEIPLAVEAVKRGAFDFLAKTYENYQHLSEHIGRALRNRQARWQALLANSRQQWLSDAFQTLEETRSGHMQRVLELVRQVSDTPLTVLMEGESGVGKEIMARYIHTLSSRAKAPFVGVHLAAIPATLLESQLFGHVKGAFTGADRECVGKFELANGGTLFLDEIGELDANAQVKLLRVLQEREVERIGAREPAPVDVRVIAATNKNLQEQMTKGHFREDLYYRLNVVRVSVPPLRERLEDLPALIELLCAKQASIMGRPVPRFSESALEVLRDCEWQGNIRELENLIMRLIAVSPTPYIAAEDIPPEYCIGSLENLVERAARHDPDADAKSRPYFLARDRFERYLVRLTVNQYRGDKHAAAEALGISLSTVNQKLRDTDETWRPGLL